MTIKANGINQKKIEEYFTAISSKHELNMESLIEDWNNIMKVSDTNQDVPLSKKLKKELQEMCRERGLKTTGTKEELIARINGGSESSVDTDKPVKKALTSKKKQETEKNPVAKKLTSKIPVISIRRNQFGNHEHAETSLIFDTKTKKVIGRQNTDGSIDDLTTDDIDTCNQYKFDYILPDNLDKSGLDDVSVDELESDEEIVDSDDDLKEDEFLEEELLDEEDDIEEEEDDEEY